jgi:ATP-dependent protease ClpP protease subunit
MSAEESKEFGLVDEVVESRPVTGSEETSRA